MANSLTHRLPVADRISVHAPALLFTVTIFLSATLLFSVQPMFTKLILPLLGGASSVWNTAMVFFQAMLLGGYIYAHLSTRYLPLRIQIGLHVAITVVGLTFLPLAIGAVDVPDTGMPTLWLLALFFATVGAPFFALSANAPLLQRWFSLTDHPDAKDPYFLYSASNAASLLILCAYPILIEPTLRLGEQTGLWTLVYAALIVLIAAAGVTTMLRARDHQMAPGTDLQRSSTVTWTTILFWLLVSFVPSSLMLGVTSYMTSNIASVPLLWIVPLALYLLTFVIVFAKRPLIRSEQLAPFIPWLILITLAAITVPIINGLLIITIGLLSFFVVTLYCHARLAESRPSADRLTQFYIVMSLGGVLGGAFNALAAPMLFATTFEYPLVLFLAAFILPNGFTGFRLASGGWAWMGLMCGLACLAAMLLPTMGWLPRLSWLVVALLVFAAILPLNLPRMQSVLILFTLGGAALFSSANDETIIHQDRSFYSTIIIDTEVTPLGLMHRFMHGDTIHNLQLRAPEYRTRPASYYLPGGVFDTALASVRTPGEGLTVSLIGLGAGALSCYEQAGDRWTYFEIDPAIVSMARNPDLFSYLSDCAPHADVRIGDARQTLSQIADGSQDMIIVDAFSSGSIPAHLLTREALALYRSKLTEDGLIFFHTSNRMMDVTSVVVRLADDAGLGARYIRHSLEGEAEIYATDGYGVLVGAHSAIRAATTDQTLWSQWVPSNVVGVWTDDYGAVFNAIRAKLLQDGQAEPITRAE